MELTMYAEHVWLVAAGLVLSGLVLLGVSCGRSGREGAGKTLTSAQEDTTAVWPSEVREVRIASTFDSTAQPALFWQPPAEKGARPLLVALHTWSGDYRQTMSLPYWRWCAENDWVFIHPDFRGPDNNPQAEGSPAALQDVLDAVAWARRTAAVDSTRIYLVGVSGGGYMSLLTAGRHPEIWAGVSAWVPITDLASWYEECAGGEKAQPRYAADIVAACGGPPGQSAEVDSQYRSRSPLTFLAAAAGLPLDLNAGIHDGHSGSVPVSHSLHAFNVLAAASGLPESALSQARIDWFVSREQVPPELAGEAPADSLYGDRRVLFRRAAGPARVTIFEGGHEIVYRAALSWLAGRRKGQN
jgi:poly(3-hydroxybutyrate) depolymerase